MKKIVEFWKDGIACLITEHLISFYTFFTIVFAECAYLWSHFSSAIAIPFTLILLAYVINIIVFAWLKGNWEGTKKELIFSRFYVITFIGLFIIGCTYNASMSIELTIIPLVVTLIWIQLRIFQDYSNISRLTDKLFGNKFFYFLSQVIVIGCPYIVFVIFISMIPALSILLKLLISIIYWFCIPLIPLLEDETAACNIFEIAYDITWDEEFEELIKKMNETKNKKD